MDCAVDDCSRPAKTRGWCGTHYYHVRVYGDPLKGVRTRTVWKYPPGTLCSVENCTAPVDRFGWCFNHAARAKRNGGDPLGGRVPPGEPQRYFNEQIQRETNECILWPYNRNPGGYGILGKRTVNDLAAGPKPSPTMYAAHSCRNRHCFNPRHVSWKTPAENQADRFRDGTVTYKSKLTEKQVREIRASENTIKALAAKYQVSQSNISAIRRKETWKHI